MARFTNPIRRDVLLTRIRTLTAAVLIAGVLSIWTSGTPQSEKLPDGRGGSFDVTRHNIPLDQIRGGGPP